MMPAPVRRYRTGSRTAALNPFGRGDDPPAGPPFQLIGPIRIIITKPRLLSP